MPYVESDQLKLSIEAQHGSIATLTQSVPLLETFEGQTVWEAIVHVFGLDGHPKANKPEFTAGRDEISARFYEGAAAGTV